VPANQLSLAIGNRGQNARLAAGLTGFKIDIISDVQAKELEKEQNAEEEAAESEEITEAAAETEATAEAAEAAEVSEVAEVGETE
jgi:N utilization substance protein A